MPELPEVETVRRGLASHMEGQKIVKVTVRDHRLRLPVPKDFSKQLTGRTVNVIERRAKYLLLHCSGKITLIIHLGMSGSVIISKALPNQYQKHDHVVFELSDGSVAIYNDPRRFGLMLITDTATWPSHALFAHLGPEPLVSEWDGHALYDALHARKAPVKSVIMDQQVVVGVGNIYACEALFESYIHPARRASEVSKKETKTLAKAIRAVLEAAIRSGGSTLRDYVRSSGDAGYFQHHFKVYGRKNLPCYRCNTPIAVIRQSGRSTFFCPHCQSK